MSQTISKTSSSGPQNSLANNHRGLIAPEAKYKTSVFPTANATGARLSFSTSTSRYHSITRTIVSVPVNPVKSRRRRRSRSQSRSQSRSRPGTPVPQSATPVDGHHLSRLRVISMIFCSNDFLRHPKAAHMKTHQISTAGRQRG